MERSKYYKDAEATLKQGFQELSEKIERKESSQLDVYTFIDILNTLEEGLKRDFELIEDIRSRLRWQEEVLLLCGAMDNSVLFSNTLKDWIFLRKIEGPDYYSAIAHQLVKQSQTQNSLNYISYIQTSGLPDVSFDSWEDQFSFNHSLLNAYDILFSGCFTFPSFFFKLQNREKKHHQKHSIKKGAEDAIRDYQRIVKSLPCMAVLIEQAALIQICRAGCLILDSLAVGEGKKTKEAKGHLEILRDFLLYKGKTMKSLAAITELRRDIPGFCQVLFLIKKELERESKYKKDSAEMRSVQRLIISLPQNFSYYFNQFNKPQFLRDRLDIFEGKDFVEVIVSLFPDSLEEIHRQVRESTMVNVLEDYINLCDILYWQEFDFPSVKENFVNYAVSVYNVQRKTAEKIYKFLDKTLEGEDWALVVVVADIVLTTYLRGSIMEGDYLRMMVEHRLISKILDWLKKNN